MVLQDFPAVRHTTEHRETSAAMEGWEAKKEKKSGEKKEKKKKHRKIHKYRKHTFLERSLKDIPKKLLK